MKHGHEHAAWTWKWKLINDKVMHHGVAEWTWTCTMDMYDMDMHHGQEHSPWTCTRDMFMPCGIDMNTGIDYCWTGALDRICVKVRNCVYCTSIP
jgi:hypothetical protein